MRNTNNDDMRDIDLTTEMYLQFPLHEPDNIVLLERHVPFVAFPLHIPIRRAHKAEPVELFKALAFALHFSPGISRQLDLTAALSMQLPRVGSNGAHVPVLLADSALSNAG